MITAITVVATVVTGICVFMRRTAWGCRFELGASIVVVAMLACMLLISPPFATLWSGPLHAVTGLWNVEDLLGHLVYLMGLITLGNVVAGRIDLGLIWLRPRLEIFLMIVPALLIGIFTQAAPVREYQNLFEAPLTWWLALYWLVVCSAAAWLIVLSVRLLVIVRRDPRSRTTANIYLTALFVDLGCVASVVASQLIHGYPHVITWLLLDAAVCGYAIAPAYSWRQKTRPLDLRPIDPTTPPKRTLW
jgi:hypothetical protein